MNDGLRKALITLAIGGLLASLAAGIALRPPAQVRRDLGGMAAPTTPLPVVRPEGGPTEQRLAPKDFAGKPLLLHFWAPSCKPCVAEMPAWQQRSLQSQAQGYAVLAVAGDDAEAVQGFLRAGHYTLPVVLDATGQWFEALRIGGIPATAAVDAQGKVVQVREGMVDDAALAELLAAARGAGR